MKLPKRYLKPTTLILNVLKRTGRQFLERAGYKIYKRPVLTMNAFEMRRFHYLGRMFQKISSVAGDIVECGVFQGGRLLMLTYFTFEEQKTPPRLIWGFDSFQGFPEPTVEDASYRKTKKGEFGETTVRTVLRFLRDSGLNHNFIKTQIRLVPGFFHESLKKFPDRSIALLHLDCDLYQSYRDALTALFPKVAEGGIVLFDEYGKPPWPGAKRAVDEYFAAFPSCPLYYDEIMKKYFVIKKI